MIDASITVYQSSKLYSLCIEKFCSLKSGRARRDVLSDEALSM